MLTFIARELDETANFYFKRAPDNSRSAWFCIHVKGENDFQIHKYVDEVRPGVYGIQTESLVRLPTEEDNRDLEELFKKKVKEEGLVILVEESQEVTIMTKSDYKILMNL